MLYIQYHFSVSPTVLILIKQEGMNAAELLCKAYISELVRDLFKKFWNLS
jgi:hypothetical protein